VPVTLRSGGRPSLADCVLHFIPAQNVGKRASRSPCRWRHDLAIIEVRGRTRVHLPTKTSMTLGRPLLRTEGVGMSSLAAAQLSPISTSTCRANRPISLGNYPTQPVCQRGKLALQLGRSRPLDCARARASCVASRHLPVRSSSSHDRGRRASQLPACLEKP
jgi:hypothetical protein